ncbi:hypothetical protein EGW08_000423 [Elysia chlorotica]|uniref:G-protein coupled receptors family 1 profile domain-containing protein n=1 Tax=Elysia chlorotica TaxID=188477 RepID=A0A433UDM7_ELYCH|nr:hypothetical protein EGW08_000423 [Elysia chlorotica]
MKYFRWCMLIPCCISIVSSGTIVGIIGDNSFQLYGKKMAIALNSIEGIKCLLFAFNRSWKAYASGHILTFNSSYSQYFICVVMWLPSAIGRMGILLNCAIAVERFFIIAFPIKFHKKRLIKHENVCIMVITISMLLYQMSPVILFIMYFKPYLDYSKTFGSDDVSSIIVDVNPEKFELYTLVHLVGAILFRLTPTAVTIIFNIVAAIKLYRQSKRRRILVNNTAPVSSRKIGSSQTNRMLLISSFLYALMTTLKPLNNSLRLVIPTYGEGRMNVFIYHICNDACLLLDNLIPLQNLIVYSYFSTQFSEHLKALRRCQKRRWNSPPPST